MKKPENKFDIDKHGNPFPMPAEVAKNLGLKDRIEEQQKLHVEDPIESTRTDKLAEALLLVQQKLRAVKKDANNPFFKSSYATLQSTWEACREALQEAKLVVTQTIHSSHDHIYLRTRLMHVSGQSIDSECPLLCKEIGSMQALGSAISYARRYSLAAIVGLVTDEDDDGNAASHAQLSHGTPATNQRPTTFTKITAPQAKRFYAIQMSNKKTDAEVHHYLRTWGYASANDIHPKDYEAMCRGDKANVSQHKDHETPPIDDSDIPF